MNNPRIYIAIATFHPLVGGAEKQALMQGRCLRARGIEATVLTFHHRSEWPQREEIEGVPVIRVAGSVLHNRSQFPRPVQKLLYLIAMMLMGWSVWRHRQHFDMLHVYQLNIIALPTAFACWLARKAMIVAIRCVGSEVPLDTHQSLQAGSLDPSLPCLRLPGRFKPGHDLEDLERLGQPFVRLTHTLLLRIHAVVLVLSTRMKRYPAAHHFPLPDVRLIPNGIDITQYSPQDVQLQTAQANRERACTVVCVARLSYEKGIDTLLHAWHLVQHEMPEARLRIVGDGILRSQLPDMAEALGISSSVTFAGEQRDIPAQLHSASFAVSSSRWEGMPNAVLEAMACGLPCIATRVSGSEDIIQHGRNGLLVDAGDYHAMAQAILALLRNPDCVRAYGQAARERIEQGYALEHITDRYVALYQHIFERRKLNNQRKKVTQPCVE